ncbi:MAG: hypothetical protein OSJ62_17090, partial [Lachnospiraceae bacterium]|nr:hypothetical protein [Lachnospiraceae bacterium]
VIITHWEENEKILDSLLELLLFGERNSVSLMHSGVLFGELFCFVEFKSKFTLSFIRKEVELSNYKI